MERAATPQLLANTALTLAHMPKGETYAIVVCARKLGLTDWTEMGVSREPCAMDTYFGEIRARLEDDTDISGPDYTYLRKHLDAYVEKRNHQIGDAVRSFYA